MGRVAVTPAGKWTDTAAAPVGTIGKNPARPSDEPKNESIGRENRLREKHHEVGPKKKPPFPLFRSCRFAGGLTVIQRQRVADERGRRS